MGTQRLRITGVLELDTAHFPPDDEASQDWLINDILLGDNLDRLILHSNEIGDALGPLHIEAVVACAATQPKEDTCTPHRAAQPIPTRPQELPDVSDLAFWLTEAGVTQWQQIMKVGEEAGEVIGKYLALTGIPGKRAVQRDVISELADVAVAAMIAMKMMGYLPDVVLREHVALQQTRWTPAAAVPQEDT